MDHLQRHETVSYAEQAKLQDGLYVRHVSLEAARTECVRLYNLSNEKTSDAELITMSNWKVIVNVATRIPRCTKALSTIASGQSGRADLSRTDVRRVGCCIAEAVAFAVVWAQALRPTTTNKLNQINVRQGDGHVHIRTP
jgi:hypothetical protein